MSVGDIGAMTDGSGPATDTRRDECRANTCLWARKGRSTKQPPTKPPIDISASTSPSTWYPRRLLGMFGPARGSRKSSSSKSSSKSSSRHSSLSTASSMAAPGLTQQLLNASARTSATPETSFTSPEPPVGATGSPTATISSMTSTITPCSSITPCSDTSSTSSCILHSLTTCVGAVDSVTAACAPIISCSSIDSCSSTDIAAPTRSLDSGARSPAHAPWIPADITTAAQLSAASSSTDSSRRSSVDTLSSSGCCSTESSRTLGSCSIHSSAVSTDISSNSNSSSPLLPQPPRLRLRSSSLYTTSSSCWGPQAALGTCASYTAGAVKPMKASGPFGSQLALPTLTPLSHSTTPGLSTAASGAVRFSSLSHKRAATSAALNARSSISGCMSTVGGVTSWRSSKICIGCLDGGETQGAYSLPSTGCNHHHHQQKPQQPQPNTSQPSTPQQSASVTSTSSVQPTAKIFHASQFEIQPAEDDVSRVLAQPATYCGNSGELCAGAGTAAVTNSSSSSSSSNSSGDGCHVVLLQQGGITKAKFVQFTGSDESFQCPIDLEIDGCSVTVLEVDSASPTPLALSSASSTTSTSPAVVAAAAAAACTSTSTSGVESATFTSKLKKFWQSCISWRLRNAFSIRSISKATVNEQLRQQIRAAGCESFVLPYHWPYLQKMAVREQRKLMVQLAA